MAGIGRQFIINLIANAEPVEKAFAKVGKAAGRIGVPVAAAVAGITAGFAAVGAAVAKIGGDLLTLGEEFNTAYGIIKQGTGAAAEDFERLQDSFRNVAGNVSDSFEDVAVALTEVDTRLDLMGNRRLERVTKQFLDLAGITGGDVAGTIRGVTRMFNRFGVEAHMTSDMLDFMFRATQATGVSVEDLGKQTTDYGAQLMRLGFDLEEAIVFLGMMEREGASITRIMPSLNTAAQKLAGEGVTDITQGMMDFIDELRDLDEEAAELRAMEILGGQYGNFLQLVRDNKMDFGELMQAIAEGDTTIAEAAGETDGLREAWDEFKNFLKLELEGPATEVFETLKGVIGELKPIATDVIDAYGEGGLAGALDVVQKEWNRIYDEYIEPLWVEFIKFLDEVIKPLAIELGKEIGGAIASGMWSAFKAGVSNLFGPKFGDRVLRDLDVEDPLAPSPGVKSLEDILSDLGLGGRFPAMGDIAPPSLPRTGGGGGVVMMAEGGIVTSPTLSIIGEAGPEAVIPLDRMSQMGGNNVYVTVTSADPQAVVDAIRKYTRANGPLGQVVPV